MEGGVHGAKGTRVRRVGAADGATSPAVAIQPTLRPIRTGSARSGGVCEVVHRACLRACSCAGNRRTAPRELSAVSSAPKTRLLLGRAGDGETAESASEQLAPPHIRSKVATARPFEPPNRA